MRAVVLCAGLGTRLGEMTQSLPKAMLDVGGRPLLEHTLRHLKSQGIDEVAINLHFLPEKIVDYFGDGKRLGLKIKYSVEKKLLGTAGALVQLADWLLEDADDFLVLYGDVLTTLPFRPLLSLHKDRKAKATLVLHRRAQSNSAVLVDRDFRITKFLERPDPADLSRLTTLGQNADSVWVNSGIQVLSQEILSHIISHQCEDLPHDVYEPLALEGRLYGFPLAGKRVAVDSPERYREACGMFGATLSAPPIPGRKAQSPIPANTPRL